VTVPGVLSWRLSNTLDTGFCVDSLEQAIQEYGAPEIFNTDQGCQFTSKAFTGVLKSHAITISMDGRGRALDNIFVERLWRSVKHEDVYLKGYATMPELLIELTEYFVFYNTERTHQSLGYSTPDKVYSTATGGGAMILDKYSKKEKLTRIMASYGPRDESSPIRARIRLVLIRSSGKHQNRR